MSNTGVSSGKVRITECEESIQVLERRIMGIELVNEIGLSDETGQTENVERMEESAELLNLIYESKNIPSIKSWLNDIKLNVKKIVDTEDDGNNDNIYYNPEFAKHCLRICNLLPLWSAISCKIFNSKSKTSSSANIESYFKDVKYVYKDIIPCSVDMFAQKHIEGIEQHVITASKKYADFVGPIISKRNPELQDTEEGVGGSDLIERLPQKTISFQEVESNEEISCMVCRDGNKPTGAHTCTLCGKNIHIISGCSFPVGDDCAEKEGYGSKRICAQCYIKSSKLRDALNTRDEWAKPSKTKKSVYLQKNPQFDLITMDKKQNISLLKNGNLSTRGIKFRGKSIILRNTCAFDSLTQAIAGAYAYHRKFRQFADEQKDEIFELAILLAKQYTTFFIL